MEDIRNAINAGKQVTTHARSISYKGWHGSGFLDKETGTGAYLISGGANGGFTQSIGSYDTFFNGIASIGAMVSEIPPYVWLFALSAILFVVSLIVVNPILGIMILAGTILAFGCALSNYYDSQFFAGLAGLIAGTVIAGYGLVADLAIIMFGLGNAVSYATFFTDFPKRCKDA